MAERSSADEVGQRVLGKQAPQLSCQNAASASMERKPSISKAAWVILGLSFAVFFAAAALIGFNLPAIKTGFSAVMQSQYLPVGRTGQFYAMGTHDENGSFPCFRTEKDFNDFHRPAPGFDVDATRRLLARAYRLKDGDRVVGLAARLSLPAPRLEVRLLGGPDRGKTCWLPNGNFFKNVSRPKKAG